MAVWVPGVGWVKFINLTIIVNGGKKDLLLGYNTIDLNSVQFPNLVGSTVM